MTIEQHKEVISQLGELSKAMNGSIIQTQTGPQRSPGLIDLVGDAMKELKSLKVILGSVGVVLLTSVVFDILKTLGVLHSH